MKTGAIILADRVQKGSDLEWFQPMLTLEGTTLIKKAITTLRQAGVSPIVVVTGFQADALERHIAHHGTVCVCNKTYESDNWCDSLKKGLPEAQKGCEQILVVSADAPLYEVETVERLMNAEEEGDVLVPTWEGEMGFPLLVRKSGVSSLLNVPESCSSVCDLSAFGMKLTQIPVDDRGVSLYVHSKKEYEIAKQYAKEVRDANALRFDVKVYLKKSGDFFGPGVARFLLKVEEKGSMLAACQEMNMSYSKGWKMVKAVEDEMGFPFLIRQTGGSSGGSSRLTEEGREFIRRYQALQRDAYKTAEAFFSLYFSDFS